MKTYGHTYKGLLVEVIPPRTYDTESPEWKEGDSSRVGHEIPIGERYTTDFVSGLVDITGMNPQPQPNWTYADGLFAPPVNPTVNPSIAALARMVQIDTSSVKLLRKFALGTLGEQELGILRSLEEEYIVLENNL